MLRPCRYQRLASLVRTTRRTFSTDAHSSSASSDSIFTTSESPWDHVFADIDSVRPLPPASTRGPSRLSGRSAANSSNVSSHSSILGRPGRARRQAMTAQEISAFDEMFNMIFNAVSDRQAASKSSPQSLGHQLPSIGPSSSAAPLNNIFRTLRRHSSRVRWTTASDEELDRKKEEMELCDTDQELLEWAAREVFSVSEKYAEDAKKVFGTANPGDKSSPDDVQTPNSTNASTKMPPLQPPTYPYLLAHLMKLFRTTAKWEGWADLPGICTALEEMRLNGVRGDGLTKSIIEKIRREVAEARPLQLGARRLWVDLGETEVVRLLTRIEQLALKETVRRARSSVGGKAFLSRESWKTDVLDPETKRDGWEFDSWKSAEGVRRGPRSLTLRCAQ
ncbi:hypothetical protein F5141DRAFT_1186601 [Pisolithus sp. B1]|nr:hypothetical protein F5141DRAFT_1186601 [Pisolithus sp. B1]